MEIQRKTSMAPAPKRFSLGHEATAPNVEPAGVTRGNPPHVPRTGGNFTLPHPLEGKWPRVLLWPGQTSTGGFRGKAEEGVPGRGESKGVGCSAGADPPRKGSERAGWGPGCRLGLGGWVLRFVQ